jgi:acid phosphatase
MFTKKNLVALLGGVTVALAQTSSEQYPSQAEIDAARNTVLPYSPVSNVKGLAFNRFVDIWLENTVSDCCNGLPMPCDSADWALTPTGL